MRLASYNVENLFSRAKAMNQDTWAEGKPILEKFAKLAALLGELEYTPAVRRKMVQLMIDLGRGTSDTAPFVILRRSRGGLLNVDDRSPDGDVIFSRDCPEFHIALPTGERLLLLVNHLKSKGFGGPKSLDARRLLQAERVKAIYEGLVARAIG